MLSKIPSGSRSLNQLFTYQVGVLHAFSGPTGSGKTTLCAYEPIIRITQFYTKTKGNLPENSIFIVIDTDGGFDWERLEQICEVNQISYERIERHIEYQNPQEFDEQHKYITEQLKGVAENKKVLLISLDPAIAIYRGIILRTPMQHRAKTIGLYTGKLDLQLQILRFYAQKKGAIATVSTWPTSEVAEAFGQETELPFIGGRQMGFLPKTIILIDKYRYYDSRTRKYEKHPTLRVATIYKHRAKPAGLTTIFELWDGGVRDAEQVPEQGNATRQSRQRRASA